MVLFSWRKGNGLPRNVHAARGRVSPGSARPSAQNITPLGTQAITTLISGKVAPSNSASSPPRESPHTASRRSLNQGCARTQAIAFSKYSNGILTRPRGKPGCAK